MIGYAVTGSYCTHSRTLDALLNIRAKGYSVLPIISENVMKTDTRFGTAEDFIAKLENICEKRVICSICEAERLGPRDPLEALIIAPCTGNTLAKLSAGITDTTVCMAAKAHLRSDRPLLIALASNDAMSANLGNIGKLLNRKNIYFVPMNQDDTVNKPHSLVADFTKVDSAFSAMMSGEQMRPLFI